MNYNQERCLANIYELAKAKSCKIGDLEEHAGVSKGYLSRINKPDGATPSIETLMAISEALNVTVDFLVSYNPATLTKSEDVIYKFLDSLLAKTSSKVLEWVTDSYESLTKQDYKEFEVSHPLIRADMDNDDNFNGRWMWVSRFYSLFNERGTDLGGDCYHVALDSHSSVYLMNVEGSASRGIQENGAELYLFTNSEVKPLCSTFFVREEIADKLFLLLQTVEEVNSHVGLDADTQRIISRFINM